LRRNIGTLIIQVGDAADEKRLDAVRKYYSEYLNTDPLNISLCLCSTRDFLTELRDRRGRRLNDPEKIRAGREAGRARR
jgi:hypothetical protein